MPKRNKRAAPAAMKWDARLRAALEELGWSTAELARRMGHDDQAFRDRLYKYVRGNVKNPRGEMLEEIAAVVGKSAQWLRYGGADPTAGAVKRNALDLVNLPTQAVNYPVLTARYVGRAEAGIWQEGRSFIDTFDPDLPVENDQRPPIPLVPKARYRGMRQFAVLVSGSSVNKTIPDGFYAICVPYWEAREAITDGDLVLVERRRAGEFQATIKRVRKGSGGYELWPESTDKRWQDPIRLGQNNSDRDFPEYEIDVVGLVIGQYGDIASGQK